MIKIQKLIVTFCIMLFAVSVFTACGDTKVKTSTQSNVDTFIDCVGRKIEVPKNIKKIAAIDSFVGEAMIMIGAGENMVACPQGVKSDKLLQEIYPGLSEVNVVQSGGSINAEALLALNPDVVLVKYDLYATEGEVAKLDKLGIPYLVIEYTNMEEQIEALRLIGEVVGGKSLEKAEKICDYYQNTIDLVKGISKKIPKEDKRSVFHSIDGTFMTDGDDSLGADWIDAVGCINVSVGENLKSENGRYFTSEEQVFAWNPDVIICGSSLTKDYFMKDESWQGLRAVYENKIYNIPVSATRWGEDGSVEIFFGMLWLGVTVYPEYYSQIDLKLQVVKFYNEILGITIDDDTYSKILLGEGIRMASQNAGK